jgi:hypothetical protein
MAVESKKAYSVAESKFIQSLMDLRAAHKKIPA